MRTLSARPWPITLAETVAPLRASPTFTPSLPPSIRTLSSLISLPTSTSSSSTRRVSPCITRYCLPPVTTTAYMTRFLCSYFGRCRTHGGRTEAEFYGFQRVGASRDHSSAGFGARTSQRPGTENPCALRSRIQENQGLADGFGMVAGVIGLH